jgi:NADH:ubiquinone oxidoreductase subunit 3 (subunit A)
MFKTHLLILLLFFFTIVLLSFILYLLSIILFNSGVSDELQIERLYAYECGFNSFSDARDAFDIKFYLVAVLFLIFDLEISFLFPLSTAIISLNITAFFGILYFLIILTIGFIYEWRKGGLDW